jgi:hypothetical protein
VWQHDETAWMAQYQCSSDENDLLSVDKTLDFNTWWKRNTRHVELHTDQATGPCFARHLAESLWRGEVYILQIDSHMRFRYNWDNYLIQVHQLCITKLNSLKPVLTTYPLGYSLPNNVPLDTSCTILVSRYKIMLSLFFYLFLISRFRLNLMMMEYYDKRRKRL